MKHIYILLCLFLLSAVASADNVIVGAFGQKLGAIVDEKLELNRELDSGALQYEFKPLNPYPTFTTYWINVTPVSKTIFGIWMIGQVDTDTACSDQLEILKSVVKQKYPFLKHNEGALQSIGTHREREIHIYCDYYPTRIVMWYRDLEIGRKVLEEKVSLIDKSNF